jgi:hypothetical protein
MSRVRVECFAVSIDGYGAGLDQSLDQSQALGLVARNPQK